jgi:hypothetical protein
VTTTVQADLRLQRDRDRAGVDAEGFQKTEHRAGRRQRLPAGIESAQVDIQLSVGEPVQVLMSPVQGQPGLADPAGSADRGDLQRATDVRWLVQASELVGAAGEQTGRGRQLSRDGNWCRRPGQVTGQGRRLVRHRARPRGRRRMGKDRCGAAFPGPPVGLLDPVAGVGHGAPFGRAGTEHVQQCVQAVGGGQGAGGEVLGDRGLGPAGPGGQLAVGQVAVPAAAGVPAPQIP